MSITLTQQVLQVLQGKLKVVRVRNLLTMPTYKNGETVLLMFANRWRPATVIEQPNILGHYGVRFDVTPGHTITWFAHTVELMPAAR